MCISFSFRSTHQTNHHVPFSSDTAVSVRDGGEEICRGSAKWTREGKKKGRGKPEICTYYLVSRDRKEMMHTLMHEKLQIANRKKEEPAKIDGSREAG
jgi:hypothetical protein